jgi:AraC-like DNA-binding protein/quercetin dioxygenase-like cupin family protein
MNAGTNYFFIERMLPEPYRELNLIGREQGWRMEEHDHTQYQLIWIVQGTLTITNNGVSHILRRGHLCITPPGERHALRSDSGYMQVGIDLITSDDRRGMIPLFTSKIKQFVIVDQNDLLHLIPDLKEKYNHFSVVSRLQIALVLDELLLSTIRLLDGETTFRRQMVLYLERFMSEKLTLEQIAHNMSYSPSHLERLTHRDFGCSVMELFLKMKLHRACLMMMNTNLSINEIGQSLGFYDQAYFSRFFKQRMNMSPLQYKNLHN